MKKLLGFPNEMKVCGILLLVKLKQMNLFSMSFILAILLTLSTSTTHASSDRIGDLIDQDNQNRMFTIHQTVHDLNDAQIELEGFRADLLKAQKASKSHHSTQVIVRDGAAVIAAIGFVGTALYQSKGLNPGKVILWGGYGVSTIASIVGLLENHTLKLNETEIVNLEGSVADLEKRVDVEKANLTREQHLLCASLKSTHSACLQ